MARTIYDSSLRTDLKQKRDKLNPDLTHIIIEEKIQKFDYKRSDSSVTIGLDGFGFSYCRNMT